MLAALGLTSVDQLFEDIPAELRASPLDLPEPEPELELAARLSGAGRAQPDGPRLVPRGRRLPPLEPAGGRPAPAARRVVHGLHAVPAGDQPGHPPEHLRVRVAAGRAGRPRHRLRLALRRRGGDGRGRADDLPGDPPRARPHLARRPPALPGHDPDLLLRAAWSSTRSRSSPTGEAAGTTDLAALERMLADPDRPVAGRHRRPARLPGPARADAGDRPPGARRRRAVRRRHRAGQPGRPRPRPARTARTSRPARASRSASPRSTAGRTSASSPRPRRSSARSPAVSSG